MEIKDMPIEELGLGDDITNYLKSFFIYTIGQLIAKTRSDLERIRLDSQKIEQIEEALEFVVELRLCDTIEPEDEIENIDFSERIYMALKRAGISRISDLVRLTDLEIFSIKGVQRHTKNEILQALEAYLCERLDVLRETSKLKGKKNISIGYLVGLGVGKRLRDENIYTVRDILLLAEEELAQIIIDKTTITKLKRRLAELDESFIIGSEREQTELEKLRDKKRKKENEKREGDQVIRTIAEIIEYLWNRGRA